MKARRAAFVREFLVDGNATQAAIRAGYSPKSAVHSAKRLLRIPAIVKQIAEAQVIAAQRNELTVDRVIQELMCIAFSDGSECFPKIEGGKVIPPNVHNLTDSQRRTISDVSVSRQGVRVYRFDKIKALELLGRYLGMYVDRHEVTGDDGGPLVVVQGGNA
jgi:phage terminase small subunit